METFTYGFESEDLLVIVNSTVTLSHPGIESDSKGLVVRQIMWYMI